MNAELTHRLDAARQRHELAKAALAGKSGPERLRAELAIAEARVDLRAAEAAFAETPDVMAPRAALAELVTGARGRIEAAEAEIAAARAATSEGLATFEREMARVASARAAEDLPAAPEFARLTRSIDAAKSTPAQLALAGAALAAPAEADPRLAFEVGHVEKLRNDLEREERKAAERRRSRP